VLARIRKSMDEKDKGFTLVELLVVMIIIGILAAVAIPVFLNQRSKARDTSTKADVSTVGKEIATYYVDGTGTLTAAVNAAGDLAITETGAGAGSYTATIALSSGTAVKTDVKNIGTGATPPIATNWCVALTNPNGQTKDWQYSAQGGLEAGDC
jgi:type IV pilus assembly protein PilA